MHMMAVSDMDAAVNENGRNESEEKLMQISGFRNSIIIFVYLAFAHALQWSI